MKTWATTTPNHCAARVDNTGNLTDKADGAPADPERLGNLGHGDIPAAYRARAKRRADLSDRQPGRGRRACGVPEVRLRI